MAAPTSSGILDQVYFHLAQDDWLAGVDLYQEGKVTRVQIFDGLVTGAVAEPQSGSLEVRLKIHPSATCIQWIECTCRKNRAKGFYCQHIAALMMHIDRERPEIFRSLDARMPLKPPAGLRLQRPSEQKATGDAPAPKRKTAATTTILEHLKGCIHGVTLIGQGPNLRIRLEIKPGHLTYYDLELDNAAQFLTTHTKLRKNDVKLSRLILSSGARIGTRVLLQKNDDLIVEKVLGIRLAKRPTPNEKARIHVPYTLLTASDLQHQRQGDALWLFVPLKHASGIVGTSYAYIPQFGYYKIEAANTDTSWLESPLERVYAGDEVADFLRTGIGPLQASGPVWLDPRLKGFSVQDAPVLQTIKLQGRDGDWFLLDPRYGNGETSVSMIDLMRRYRDKGQSYIKTGNAWVRIPELVTQFDWQIDEKSNSLKVNSLGLLRLRAAAGEMDCFVGSKQALNQIRNKVEFDEQIEVPTILHSRLDLRPYQETGLRWFWWLYTNGLHGLLADEMGLGKTHQAMALLSALQMQIKTPKFLIVCPTTVLDHWDDKVNDFAPNLRTLKYHGTKRALALDLGKRYHTVITSYGIMLRDIAQLSEIEWTTVILDEAHFVKNNATATYRAACRLTSNLRLCLSGTPMENNLSELKNIFDFLLPGYLGSDAYFRKQFVLPLENGSDLHTEIALQRLIHPFKLRRTKENVLPDLPEKVENLSHCRLSQEQTALYREILSLKASNLIKQLEDDHSPIPYLHVFATLTLLKQICNHPAMVVKGSAYTNHESGKFELMRELLDEALGSGHKVVIYSQYATMVQIIERYLIDCKIGYVTLTGRSRNRGDIVKKFQTTPDIHVFVGSLLAGGIGIDLTAASVVIHYDRWWNASKENQATDRVHRIGQNKNVQVFKLVTRGTLEEKIDQMIAEKQSLFDRFVNRDEEVFKKFSRQELIELLQ